MNEKGMDMNREIMMEMNGNRRCGERLTALLLVLGTVLWAIASTAETGNTGALRGQLAPLDTVLAGEPCRFWGQLEGAVEGRCRWEATAVAGEVSGTGLGNWRFLSAGGALEEELVCVLPEGCERDRMTVRLAVETADGLRWEGSRAVTVWAAKALPREQVCGIRRELAVVAGLHWLQLRQRGDGHWGGHGPLPDCQGNPLFVAEDPYNEMGSTAFALWAFGVHGWGVERRTDNPFAETVRRGMAYILERSVCGEMSDKGVVLPREADSNGNGRYVILGGRSNVENYVNPICLAALVSCGTEEMTVTVCGEQTKLSAVLSDARDFIVKQLYDGSGWPGCWLYNNAYRESYGGYDLSIAGWNYLGLEAAESWGIAGIGSAKSREMMAFIGQTYSFDQGNFQYRPWDYDANTLSVDASAALGIRWLVDRHLEDGGYAVFSELGSWRTMAPGAALSGAIQRLGQWLYAGQFASMGYPLWNVCKAMMANGVTRLLMGEVVYDWRYGAENGVSGVWEAVMRLQRPDGGWDFHEAHGTILKTGQEEMHTALMALSLSDCILKKPREAAVKVAVCLDMPEDIRETMQLSEGLTKSVVDDGCWQLCAERTMRPGEAAEWSYVYGVGEATGTGRQVVQSGGLVSWQEDGWEESCYELEPLVVQRDGASYRLAVAWREMREAGQEMTATVRAGLPWGRHVQLLTVPAGSVGQVTLWACEGEVPMVWQRLERLDEGLADCRLLTKAAVELSRWQTLEWASLPGTRGRVLGAEIGEPLAQDSHLRLFYDESEVVLSVFAGMSGGPQTLIYEEPLPWETAGGEVVRDVPLADAVLTAGQAVCTAMLTNGETVLAEAEDGVWLPEMAAGCVESLLSCAPQVEIGEVLTIHSSLASTDRKAVGVKGNVTVSVLSPLAEVWEWDYDGRQQDGCAGQVFYWRPKAVEGGRCIIEQIVQLDNGQELQDVVEVEVVNRGEMVRGWFAEAETSVTAGEMLSVVFWGEAATSATGLRLWKMEETAEGPAEEIACTLRWLSETTVTGCASLVWQAETDSQGWLLLTDDSGDRVLDTMAVEVHAAAGGGAGIADGDGDDGSSDTGGSTNGSNVFVIVMPVVVWPMWGYGVWSWGDGRGNGEGGSGGMNCWGGDGHDGGGVWWGNQQDYGEEQGLSVELQEYYRLRQQRREVKRHPLALPAVGTSYRITGQEQR